MPRLILDTNMLLVLIVGTLDRDLLGRTKRLKEYEPDDHGRVVRYANRYEQMVLLTNVVTETSNFLGQMEGERRRFCMEGLAELIRNSDELHIPPSVAVAQPEYIRLGITDASILCGMDDDT